MAAGLTLVCPIRGRLKAKTRSKDGLTPTEELYRVEAIKYLIRHGYPAENFLIEPVIKRFGNSGRNSFRADFAVLDVPAVIVDSGDTDEVLHHALVIAEIKRDNADAEAAKAFQVRPMLDFAVRENCIALYWDDVEQRIYWVDHRSGYRQIQDGPLALLPVFGGSPKARPLTFSTIDEGKPLLGVFARIEDILHSTAMGPNKRFTVMLQLLLAKLHDEHAHQSEPDKPLDLQDYAALGVDSKLALAAANRVLKRAVDYYKNFLPEPVPSEFSVNADTLVEVMKVLAPTKIVAMRRSVIQDFYMYFARHIYKWDLAQYFTPTALTEFIVDVLNPQFGEHVMDPACGSADFLTAAFRRGQSRWENYASNIWGSDVSSEAVQVATLNMILNGDGRSNIRLEDSLASIKAHLDSCHVVVCNPPFGTRIVERNATTLALFDMGHEWGLGANGDFTMTDILLESQDSGILFAEACVKILHSGGRMALVVPNGYLGNRSIRYAALREWLLRNCRVMVIVALPRFTFKASGADVSASVIFCEKRSSPLPTSEADNEYEMCVEIIDRVGWLTGDKKGTPLFRRDPEDGSYLLDDEGRLIPDSDFDDVLARIRSGDTAYYAPWLVNGLPVRFSEGESGWTVPISDVTSDSYRTLDPKRLCRKFVELQAEITGRSHFHIGEIVDFVPERTSSRGTRLTLAASKIYRHIEIQDVETGSFRWHERRGWELPQRARHIAEAGDIYIGGIRNSVRKWFLVDRDARNLVVTNGMHRMRIKEGMEELLLDLLVGLCSEAYRVQMRGLARGADGLAEISIEDVAQVVLPRIEDMSVREEIEPFVDQLLAGHMGLDAVVNDLLSGGRLRIPRPALQPDHTALL
jgi:type I restriction enzyme M protein